MFNDFAANRCQGLTEHLDTNSFFNSHQCACMKHHSTETVLLSIHDHLVQAIRHQIITGLSILSIILFSWNVSRIGLDSVVTLICPLQIVGDFYSKITFFFCCLQTVCCPILSGFIAGAMLWPTCMTWHLSTSKVSNHFSFHSWSFDKSACSKF